ncbi:MAG: class I SAM-dependent methyltransferase [Armatimonadota bacterium]|nr:class I SAM-dependent methyltransferase [Armatimonadota bacterium]
MAIYRRIYSSPEWREAYVRAAFHDPSFPVEELKGDLGAGDYMLLQAAVATQRRRLDHVLRIVDPRPGQLIADVGCGPGGVALRLADRGARVLALDLDVDTLAAVRTLSQRQSRISVLVGDCRRLPIRTASCDAAVCVNGERA